MATLSVIVPTYNRAERLRTCLAALAHQTQPCADYEVVVVVDGSTDHTRDMVASLSTPYKLRVVYQANQGQPAACNAGARVASGRYCLFLDDDICAGHRLVEEHVRLHRTASRLIGVGQITLAVSPKADAFVRDYALDWRAHYASLNSGRLPSWDDCYGGNLSVGRDEYLAAGGLAVDLGRCEDIDLAYRLMQAGLRPVYLPAAVGQQNDGKGFVALAADFERAGAAWWTLYERHPPMLPHLFSGFRSGGASRVLLRRLLLHLGVSPRSLRLLGVLTCRPGWHRFLRHYCYWRGVKRSVSRDAWRRLTHGTRILMYHAIGEQHEPATRFVAPVRRFQQQMAWLKRLRYRVLSLEEFLDHHCNHRLPPSRSVVITFDDGYVDTRTRALPILRRYGFPVTVFLVSGAVGTANLWDEEGALRRRPLLAWPDIETMRQEGVLFGAHSRTHAMLTQLPEDAVRAEVEQSRDDLERRLGYHVRTFAYPYGEHDPAIRRIAEQAGFDGSCGITPGLNTPTTPTHDLRRIEVYGTDSLPRFLWRLWHAAARSSASRKPRVEPSLT